MREIDEEFWNTLTFICEGEEKKGEGEEKESGKREGRRGEGEGQERERLLSMVLGWLGPLQVSVRWFGAIMREKLRFS